MTTEELRKLAELAELEIRETNDGAGTFLARPLGIRGPWFRCGPTHDTHPFLLAGIAERLVAALYAGKRRRRSQYLDQLGHTAALFATADEKITAAMTVLKGDDQPVGGESGGMMDSRLDRIGAPCVHGQPPGLCKDCRIAELERERDELRARLDLEAEAHAKMMEIASHFLDQRELLAAGCGKSQCPLRIPYGARGPARR